MLYPTKPSQYHQPADGLGHLIQFPVEELKKHSGRLLDIMVSNGMTIEPVSEKIWGWQRSIIAWEVNPDLLEEYYDVNRAIKIADILWTSLFSWIRHATLLKWLHIDVGGTIESIDIEILASLMSLDYKPEWEKLILDQLALIGRVNSTSNLGVEWLDAAIDEINSYILPGNRDLPSKYKDIFANFLDIMIVKLAEKGQTGDREKMLSKLINDLNKNILQKDSQEMSFEWFVNFLRKAGWDETIDAYNDFLQPKTREDIYWEQEWEVGRATWERIGSILKENWWEGEKTLVINPGSKSKISV